MQSQTEHTTPKWYGIYTRARAEKKLAEQLEAQGITCFLPLYTELRQWSDRKKKVTEPLIKRLIFVQTTANKLNDLFRFQYVTGVVRYLGKPAEIRDHEIRMLEIIAREWSGKTVSVNKEISLQLGDHVEIKRGPFTGLSGKLLAVKGKHRILVQLTSLNVEFTVDVAKSQTKKIA
jgi:transcriptional antiterminator RfaH